MRPTKEGLSLLAPARKLLFRYSLHFTDLSKQIPRVCTAYIGCNLGMSNMNSYALGIFGT
jgi:hypothetical protein